MNKKLSQLIAFFLCIILLVVTFSGCIEKEQKFEKKRLSTLEINLDHPSILPDWRDGEYHDYYGTMEMLNYFNDRFPYLVNVFSIGRSVEDRDIWCVRVTNEQNRTGKYSCLIDGCIHGNEWESTEACLYLTEYLLINYIYNKINKKIVAG